VVTRYEGLTWGEGPRHRDGALWVSDPQRGGIWTDAGGSWHYTALSTPSNGLWFLPDGRLTAALMRERRVGVWNGREFETYADLSECAVGPLGDMVGDSRGGLYVDDVGYAAHLGEDPKPGRLIYVSPDRRVRVATEGVHFPNGLALIDAGRTLVVAETWEQRLMAYDVHDDGALTGRRLYVDLRAGVNADARPDGICTTAEGSGVWVCTLDAHAVVEVSEAGVLRSVDLGPGSPVACAIDDDSNLLVTVAHTDGLPVMRAVANKTVHSTIEMVHL
jgi:sugar lactone lactonase YvrE